MKQCKQFLIRILSMAVVTAVIMTAVVYTGKHGVRKDGLYYEVSAIHPDCQMLTVNGTAVSAEEYLYWLAYDCEYLSYYVSDIDWNSEISDGMTYGAYAKTDALETVKLYSIIRQWAADNGITLTAEDQAAIAAERAQYVSYYGGEEGYKNQIKLMGVSEKAFTQINSVYYLYSHVFEQFSNPDSKLYPGLDALTAYGEDGGYMTIKEIFLATTDLSDEEKTAKRQQAEDIAAQLKAADDVNASFDALSAISEDGQAQKYPDGVTFASGSIDTALEAAVTPLNEGEVTDVVEGTGGYYVAVRLAMNPAGLLESYFSAQLQQARSDASVATSKEYESLDVGTFYTNLLSKRATMLTGTSGASAGTDAGTDSNG
ncbi:MAG: hypothetical protein GXW99_02720 [Clostridiales bacterium]|nr:hypothetical protein [Clostridiales bacterium]